MVPTRWALFEVARSGAPVWPCGWGPASRKRASEGVLRVTGHVVYMYGTQVNVQK